MAIISTYATDTSIEGTDLLLGTALRNSPPKETVNFQIDTLAEYMGGLKTVTTTVTPPDSLTMYSKPIICAPTPGANQIIIPHGLVVGAGSGTAYDYPANTSNMGWWDSSTQSFILNWFTNKIVPGPNNAPAGYNVTYLLIDNSITGLSLKNTVVNLPFAFQYGVGGGGGDATLGDRKITFDFQYRIATYPS